MKLLVAIALAIGCGFLVPSAVAGQMCWVERASPQKNSVKLFFSEQPRVVVVTHLNGTTSRFVTNKVKTLNVALRVGESMFVTQLLHSDCHVKVLRVSGTLTLDYAGEVCMPGFKCQSNHQVLVVGADGKFHKALGS